MRRKVGLACGLLLPLLLATCGGESTTPAATSVAELHFDGLYQSTAFHDVRNTYWNYLRFYPDGHVIFASSIGEPHQLRMWFRRPYHCQGTYTLADGHLHFTCTGSAGAVDYTGKILEDGLDLSSYSHINENRAQTTYTFVSLEVEEEAPSWANVSPEQVAEAKAYGVPVAFENKLGMRFVLIPAGTFPMGSRTTEPGRNDDESRHSVVLTQPFYAQIAEVTNERYRRKVPLHDSNVHAEDLNGGDQPVVEVAWGDAVAYAQWLSTQDGVRTYRLPTEAEWEYACRSGTTEVFHFGSDIAQLGEHANTEERESAKWVSDGYVTTMPATTFPASRWGLFNLHGNVAEWCLDWYGPYPEDGVEDPQGPPEAQAEILTHTRLGPNGDRAGPAPDEGASLTGPARVVRGGAWNQAWRRARSAARDAGIDGRPSRSIGFRLVSPLQASGGPSR